jgi:2-polyprenyl-3-methyl-5-hydroxy-6-metoxy-1,4-benzoquinol methylase
MEAIKKRTFYNAFNKLKKYINLDNKILEIGSYCGIFLNILKQNGYKNIQGIELSSWACNYAREKYQLEKIFNESFEGTKSFKPSSFNTIVALDVFEHTPKPNLFLSQANRLLKKNGILYLTTIDIDSLFARLMGKNWPWIMYMHFLYFGNNSIQTIFKQNGFELIEVSNHVHYASLKYAYSKFVLSLHSSIQTYLNKINFLIPNLTIPFPLGDVKTYVLKKL